MAPYFEHGRRRLLAISVLSGLLAVTVTIWSSAAGSKMVSQMAEAMKNYVAYGEQATIPPMETSVWGLVFKICVSLSVPACGIVGVLQKNRNFVCAFAGCSCFSCCCQLCTLVFLFIPLILFSLFSSSVMPFIEGCNPGTVCPPDGGNITTGNVIDCLARNTWGEYKNKTNYGTDYTMLDCNANLYLTCTVNSTSIAVGSAFEAESASWAAVQVRRLADVAPIFQDLATSAAGGEKLGAAMPMPDDARTACTVNEDRYQAVNSLVESFKTLPSLRGLIIGVTILSVISMVVSCLSAWWGKIFYDSLSVEAFATRPVVYAVNHGMAQPPRF